MTRVMDARTYWLQGLRNEDSLSLFNMSMFKFDAFFMSDDLEPVATEIVKKCVGHPLTIRCMACVLCHKSSSEWINVLQHNLWDMDLFVFPVLRINYDLFACQLKECFSYCSLYPKGWKIEKNELIQSWMAQGYLQCLKDEQQMEDLGNEFVNTLLSMSFFVGKKLDDYGNLVSFEMPDLIHEIACYVVHYNICLRDSSRLRTFVSEFARNTNELSVIFKYKHLRLLNLSKTSLVVLPYSIGKLKHLRYLNLSLCLKLTSLPTSVGKLVNLQTLKLTGCESLNFSTEVVTRLTNLRHLEIHGCKAFEGMMPTGLGKLSSLQSLSNFYVVGDKKQNTGKLNELQNLNRLGGNLEINALGQVKEAMMESQLVNMK